MRFEEENRSTQCAGILEEMLGRSYDVANRTEATEYASSGGPEACTEVVASAVQAAAEAIRKRR